MYLPAIFGLGAPELLLLFIVIFVIFGAGKLPQIGSSLGKGLRNFRKSLKGEDEPEEKKIPPQNL